MRITDIKIKNYRAFYGEHHIELTKQGKNLMVYGENGSGKSSLFTALQNFFQASVAKVDVEENIFIPNSQKDTANIKLTIRENAQATASQEFELDFINKQIVSADKALISDANKVKGFFDYRSLLETHIHYKDKPTVNIFDILIYNILPHAINRFTNKEVGKEWDKINYDAYELRQGANVVAEIKNDIENFNKGFQLLLEDIEKDTQKFIKYFDSKLDITIDFKKTRYAGRREVYGDEADLKIKYAGVEIPKHHLFLNEARLSALAISLYLASIKANPLTGTLKILVLDDLLIGLDMSNRLPLLSILKENFINVDASQEFQIVMTTYDKVWFDLVHSYFGADKWQYVEIYSKKLKDEDFELPIIKNSVGYIDKAKYYLAEKDNKAAAVYIRTEFERIIAKICEDKSLAVTYKSKKKDLSSEDFWTAIHQQTNIDENLVKEIETHRATVMNPFSHFDIEKPEFERELTDTITAIEKLNSINIKQLKKVTIEDLKKEAIAAERKFTVQQTVANKLREVIKNK